MKAKWISAVLLFGMAAPCVLASSVTVLGSMGGTVQFDGRDYGALPVRITAVTPGTHTVKVLAGGVEKTYSLTFPAGQDANPQIDMDIELGVQRTDRERDRRRYRPRGYDPYYGGSYGAGYPYGYGNNYYNYGYPYGPYYGRGGGIGFGTSFGGRRRGRFGGSGLFFGLGF
jgi:hypothetical protein